MIFIILAIFGDVDIVFDDVWSGGNNLQDSATWQWSDASAFSYEHWKPGKHFLKNFL
jgi:hypothetical protein